MATQQSVRLLSLLMVTAAITACGGGGGGGDTTSPSPAPTSSSPSPAPAPAPGSAPAPSPAPAPGVGVPAPAPISGPPPAPTEAATGLAAPTLNLSTSSNTVTLVSSFILLAQELAQAYTFADEGAAAQAIAKVSSNPTPFNCPGGGVMTSGSPGSLSYVGCGTVGGYAFTGASTIANAGPTYTLNYSNLQVTGGSAPSSPVTGQTTCVTASTNCVTTLGGYEWGYDASYANGLANGTHRCTCGNGTWNVVYQDFGATSGTAYVYATNGTATVTRQSDRLFRVSQTVNGQTNTFDVPLP